MVDGLCVFVEGGARQAQGIDGVLRIVDGIIANGKATAPVPVT